MQHRINTPDAAAASFGHFELQVLKWFCGLYTPDCYVKSIYTIYSRFKVNVKLLELRKLLLLDLLLGKLFEGLCMKYVKMMYILDYFLGINLKSHGVSLK